jgi:3-methylfumaryl-CoA hydratase
LCTARSSRRLLLELLRTERPQARLRRFSFRAISPLFDVHRFTLCGKPDGTHRLKRWTRNHEAALAMEASAEID